MLSSLLHFVAATLALGLVNIYVLIESAWPETQGWKSTADLNGISLFLPFPEKRGISSPLLAAALNEGRLFSPQACHDMANFSC